MANLKTKEEIHPLIKFLYKNNKIDVAIQQYISYLEDLNTGESYEHARLLKRYLDTALNARYLKQLRAIFNELTDFIQKKYEKQSFTYTLMLCKKSLFSLESKINKVQAEKKKTLDSVRDLLRFRLVIDNIEISNQDLIKEIYQLMDEIIFFMQKKYFGTALVEDDTNKMPPKNIHQNPNFLMPSTATKKWVNENFQNKMSVESKIKENGYQSLHCTLIDEKNNPIEFQLATMQWFFFNENIASHKEYKQQKYGDFLLHYNVFKFHYPNFYAAELHDGTVKVMDRVGIIESLPVYTRQKTH